MMGQIAFVAKSTSFALWRYSGVSAYFHGRKERPPDLKGIAKSDPVLTPRSLSCAVELVRRPPPSATAYPWNQHASVAEAWEIMALEPARPNGRRPWGSPHG